MTTPLLSNSHQYNIFSPYENNLSEKFLNFTQKHSDKKYIGRFQIKHFYKFPYLREDDVVMGFDLEIETTKTVTYQKRSEKNIKLVLSLLKKNLTYQQISDFLNQHNYPTTTKDKVKWNKKDINSMIYKYRRKLLYKHYSDIVKNTECFYYIKPNYLPYFEELDDSFITDKILIESDR